VAGRLLPVSRKKNKGGRQNKYYTHVEPRLTEVEVWLRSGLSEEQIYTNLGVSKTSWHNYKKKHVELVDTLKKGKDIQVEVAENALFKLVQGYHYEVEEVYKIRDADGFEELRTVTVTKFKPPELGAIVFLLKCKAPDQYADNITMNRIKQEELKLREKEMMMRNF
jgi:hypothetical protein